MKKPVSFLLVLVLSLSLLGLSSPSKRDMPSARGSFHPPGQGIGSWAAIAMAEPPQPYLVEKEDEDEKSMDSHLLQILKKIQEQMDEWLKLLSERIDKEDITRLEVRFLEVLRNILEWLKEKVDESIESAEKELPKKKKKELLREPERKTYHIGIV
jgi:hypothetical protein